MTKIFISYRRKDWGHTKQLADELRQRLNAEIFVDFTGIDEADFEPSILRNLSESDVVLLIVTERTFSPDRIHRDKDWVRREIREALILNKKIVLVCIDGLLPPEDIPDDIRAIRDKEGIRFFEEYFESGVQRLVNFVVRIEPSIQPRSSEPIAPQTAKSQRTLDEAETLFNDEKYAEAVTLLEDLRNSGYKSKLVNLDTIIEEAKAKHDAELHHQEAEREYKDIAALVRIANTEGLLVEAVEAWFKFRQSYPNYDALSLDRQLEVKVDALRADANKPIFGHLAVLLLAEKARDWEQVIYSGENILRIDSKHNIARTRTANAYRQHGVDIHNEKQDYDGAIAIYNRAIELDPNNADFFNQRGRSYHQKQDYDRAIEDFNRSLDLDPNNANFLGVRGNSLRQKGDYGRAIEDFNRAIELDPNNASHFRQRGLCYYLKMDDADAISDYNRAIELDPNNANYLCNRGIFYNHTGDYGRAIEDFNHAIELDPNDANYYYWRAVVYSQINRKKTEVIRNLKRAAALGHEQAKLDLRNLK